MVSDVPDQKRIAQFEQHQNYLRNLTFRVDRGQRADPLIRHTVMNATRYGALNSTGYGRPNKKGGIGRQNHGMSMFEDQSSSVLFSLGSSIDKGRPFSTQAAAQNILISNTRDATRNNTLEPSSQTGTTGKSKRKSKMRSTAEAFAPADTNTFQSI